MPSAFGTVEDVQRQLDRAIAAIDEDRDRTAEAKDRLKREVYNEARSKVVQQVEEERERVEEDLRVARKMAFAPPVLQGKNIDEAQVARWYHGEIEKLKGEREPAKILEQLQDAVLFSNPVRAKACLCQGYRLQNEQIVSRYFEAYPDEEPYWQEFVRAAEQYNELEVARNTFSAGARIRPLEHYLA